MRSAESLKIDIGIDEATPVTRRRIEEITTHKKQERLKQDSNRTTICQTVISRDTRKRTAIVMQETRQTLKFQLVGRVTSLITQPDKMVHHHQVTGQWIQTTEVTRRLVY